MAIITLNLDLSEDHKQLIRELIKYSTILIVLHLLMYLEYDGKTVQKLFGFSGTFFNDDFVNIFVFILLGVLTYNLILKNIIVIE